jgi:sugar lactone lactonase YvrE
MDSDGASCRDRTVVRQLLWLPALSILSLTASARAQDEAVDATVAITDWEISRAYPAARVNRESYPGFYAIFFAGWQKVTAAPSGFVDIAGHVERNEQEPGIVLARTKFRSSEKQEIRLVLGYGDELDLFVNGQKVYAGRAEESPHDVSVSGIVGRADTVVVTAAKGLNEILLMVTEPREAWGFVARSDRLLDSPAVDHARLTKMWETPKELLTPESVLYDRRRGVLYVTSFDARYAQASEFTGYISKLSLDGEIEELHWVSDLNAPAGMGILGDRLYVAERSQLTEIDIDSGVVLARYPLVDAEFPNDVAIDAAGNIYVSDTRPSSHLDSRIYRFKDGEVDVWLEKKISRSNGLFIHGDQLLVGNSGDGMLKAIALRSRNVTDVVCLGAGVIDGIRVDNLGNYVLSHWDGLVYVVTPAGDVLEVLDTRAEGVNSADFEYIRERNLLVVPTFLDNRVMAYRLTEAR